MLQSTSLLRGKTIPTAEPTSRIMLQSTSLLRGKTSANQEIIYLIKRFNPLPSCEGRRFFWKGGRDGGSFNPLPSCEGRLFLSFSTLKLNCFNPLPSCEGRRSERLEATTRTRFNPLPSCEGRHERLRANRNDIYASIHFPLAREDTAETSSRWRGSCFNPLPSCEGRRITSG